jgi:choline dehydrogenase-like flavoprotein
MQVDFLIVGQGLAGSLLARSLRLRGRKVHVVDDGWKSSASQVAAGLMTPLTGRRFTLTKDYPELFAAAKERLTELGVFRPAQVYRMFVDEEQRGKGLKRAECRSCRPFIERVTSAQGELDAGLTDAFGGALMNAPGSTCLSSWRMSAPNSWPTAASPKRLSIRPRPRPTPKGSRGAPSAPAASSIATGISRLSAGRSSISPGSRPRVRP